MSVCGGQCGCVGEWSLIKIYIWVLALLPDMELQKPLGFPERQEHLLLFRESPFDSPEFTLTGDSW